MNARAEMPDFWTITEMLEFHMSFDRDSMTLQAAKLRAWLAAQPLADAETVERVAMALYAQFPYQQSGEKPKWQERGNSDMQEYARKLARQALKPPAQPLAPAGGDVAAALDGMWGDAKNRELTAEDYAHAEAVIAAAGDFPATFGPHVDAEGLALLVSADGGLGALCQRSAAKEGGGDASETLAIVEAVSDERINWKLRVGEEVLPLVLMFAANGKDHVNAVLEARHCNGDDNCEPIPLFTAHPAAGAVVVDEVPQMRDGSMWFDRMDGSAKVVITEQMAMEFFGLVKPTKVTDVLVDVALIAFDGCSGSRWRCMRAALTAAIGGA